MDTVSQIKQKLDITDVVGGYISLKKAGKNYKAPCPFHSEDTPSFMVSPDLQIYKCFGCGEGGDMFNFVEKVEGVDFARALEILADKAGVEIEKKNLDPNYKKKGKIFEINTLAMEFYHHLLTKHSVGKKALNYVKKDRGLDLKTIKAFKVGYAPDKWDTLHQFLTKKGYSDEEMSLAGVVLPKRDGKGFIDKFRGRVVFPLIDVTGRTVGFTGRDLVGRDPKYLNTQETLVYNKSGYLYGLDKAKVEIKKKGVIFVEGQVDVITAYKNGIKNVIASSGTALTAAQLRIMSRYTKEITFCFDSDEAGMAATTRALELTDQFDFEVNVALIPEKYADLDEFITSDVKEAKAALKNAIPIYDFYLVRAMKKYDKDDAYGKKKIVEFLAPIYSKISNNVVKDHYIKELSEKVGTSEDAVRSSLQKAPRGQTSTKKPEITAKTKEEEEAKRSPEDYALSLILRTGIDTIGSYVYKLALQDFVSDRNKHIFTELKKYIDSKPEEFDIKYFTGSLDGEYKELAVKMCLWDFGEITSNQDLLASELKATISRLKQRTTKRKLKDLTEQLKLAEMEKNAKLVEELTKEFKDLSETLI